MLPKGAKPSANGAPTNAVALDKATAAPNWSFAAPSPATSCACCIQVVPLRLYT